MVRRPWPEVDQLDLALSLLGRPELQVMMQVMAVGARGTPATGFHARLRDGHGQWAFLRASPLVGGGDDQIAVTIESASGDQLLGLLLTAYGLTPRERDICHEVIAGRSTADIAEHLFISANTVQDHLKSVFSKVGVRSRGELVARLRPDATNPDALIDQGSARPRTHFPVVDD